MTSFANCKQWPWNYDINFLQDPQLRDSLCSRMSIQLLLCTVATLTPFWGPSFDPHAWVICHPWQASLVCHKGRISTHAVSRLTRLYCQFIFWWTVICWAKCLQIQTSCYHSTIYGVIWKITAHQFCSKKTCMVIHIILAKCSVQALSV